MPVVRHLSTALLALSLALMPATASGSDGYKRTYTVKKGDTLSKIAKRLNTTVRKLKRWNRMRKTTLRVGRKLKYYSSAPARPTRIVKHRIKKGDTLLKLAKRYKTTVRKIKRRNRIRKHLRVGKVLKIEVVGPENPSVATGKPQYGKLEHGEQLPDGPGWYRKRPRHTWGTNETVTHLMKCIPTVREKFDRRTHDVVIGDLSRKGGGFLPPHRSHQNGLDVDIGYYHKDKRKPKGFYNATGRTLDVKRTWHLLSCFLKTGDVKYIFVDYSLQGPLYRYAKRKGMSRKRLAEVFQFPRSRGTHKGIIRHTKGHKNHFHIRFVDTAVQAANNK